MGNIGKRIKELRKMLGLSQKEFGERIGKSLRAVQNWEYSKTNIDESTLRLIAQTFGVNLEWLKTGEGEMFSKGKKQVIEDIENAIKQIEGKVPRYLKKALERGDTNEILEAIADFLYDLADEIQRGSITAETIKGNIAIGSNIKQKTDIRGE